MHARSFLSATPGGEAQHGGKPSPSAAGHEILQRDGIMKRSLWSAPARPTAVALSLVLGACGDSITQTPPTGEIVSMRVEVGPDILSAPAGLPDTLHLRPDPYGLGDPTRLSVQPVSAAGTELPPLSDFEITVTPADPTVVEFVQTGAWGGLLYRHLQATTSMVILLVEKSTGRTVLGPYSIPTTVEP